jgi:ppGpp synthetase/RelA/SpoT-type nucleotidyltranferase
VLYEIISALDASGVKYHSVITRIKDIDSLLKKVESKQIKDPFSEVPDIVGARIVTLFLSDIQRIIDLMSNTFDVCAVDNKIEDSDPRLFGYFSVHLHARIKHSYVGTRYDRIKPLKFEVQIRTIAMDAWAAASHYLAYKTDEDVPSDLKRDLNALSGLFYLADKHFETFFRSRAANLKRLDRALKTRQIGQTRTLDLDTVISFLADRYPEREAPEAGDASGLLRDLKKAGIGDLASLESLLNGSEKRFLTHEVKFPPGHGTRKWKKGEKRQFTATGVVRVMLRKDWRD